jgi:hypothetical protein
MLLSVPLIEGERIFSNIFIDSYRPRKVIIIEKAPVRLMFFGETHETNITQITKLIKAIDTVKFEPNYKFNSVTEIDVFSKLIGDRNRKSMHSVVSEQPNENHRRY